MTTHGKFAAVAALAGDPARAGMLHALLGGRALTASELASVAGVTPQTASGHLARLTAIDLVSVMKQGRHRYYQLASPAVARMMEAIMEVASIEQPSRKRLVTGPRDEALRAARICYDHLAGQLGVALADALVAAGHAELLQGRRHCHRARPAVPEPDRRPGRSIDAAKRQAGAPGPVPPLPRLERATDPSGWIAWRRDLSVEPR